MDKIALEGVVLYGYHGTYPEEKKLGQRFLVDVDLFGNFQEAAAEDNLEKAVDYVKVCEQVKKIVEGDRFQLLEALAEHLCKTILSQFSRVEKITVRIKKPHVPIQASLSWALIEVTRSR